MLVAASLASLLPIVNSQNGAITNTNSKTDSFPEVKDDFYMPTAVENDIYAIGGDGNVWHWNGAWWWQVTSGRAVEGRIQVVSQEEIYGLSRTPTGYLNVYKWNGTAWTAVTRDGSLIDSFQVVSETQIYAIGEDHQVYLWNGTNWNGCTHSVENVKDQIQVINEQIYSTNDENQVAKWNGTEWEPVTDQTPIKDYFSLKSEKEIYSIDQEGNIIFWNGENWHPLTSSFTATRRLFYVSSSEIFALGGDGMVWQWNGETSVEITTSITDSSSQTGCTYYRAKYIEGNVTVAPAVLAYKDRLIIAAPGTGGLIYIREWMPLRNESWDSATNSKNLGENDWYCLGGSSTMSPQLEVENGVLSVYVQGAQGVVYKKSYLTPYQWSDSWEQAPTHCLSPGPFNSVGYAVLPITSSGYPSAVALVKYENFTVPPLEQGINKLVIYEFTTKEFTSPNGPGTGTFASATEKLDYLKDLGINAIWISGTSWSDPLHFTNTSNQYSAIHPTLIDPSLGTAPSNITKTQLELKSFIAAAHQREIKILVEVISHGVMSYSPLVSENSTLPSYVLPYPVPLNITAHPDWFGALTYPDDEEIPPNKLFFPKDTRMINYVGGYKQTDLDSWWVNIWTNYILEYGIDGLRIDLGSSRFDLWAKVKENVVNAGRQLLIMPEGEVQNYPFEIGLYDLEQVNYAWTVLANTIYNNTSPAYGAVVYDMKTAVNELIPNLPREYNTVPISCHDSLDYDLKGSRFKMGYGAIFTPFIPIFMAGEEFNNPLTTVPGTTVPWLLSSPLQWDLLKQTQNRLFHDDMKKAIEIRENEPALTYISQDIQHPNVVLINYSASSQTVPTPYLRFLPNGSQAVLIAGNNNTKAVNLTMQLPLTEVGLAGYQYYDAIDIWNGTTSIISAKEAQHYNLSVAADNFRIIKIVPHTGPLPTQTPTPTPSPVPTANPTAQPSVTYNTPNPTPSNLPSEFLLTIPLTITAVTITTVVSMILAYTQRKTFRNWRRKQE